MSKAKIPSEIWEKGGLVPGESHKVKRYCARGHIISKSSFNDINSKFGWTTYLDKKTNTEYPIHIKESFDLVNKDN